MIEEFKKKIEKKIFVVKKLQPSSLNTYILTFPKLIEY